MNSGELMTGNYLRYGSDIVKVTDLSKHSIGYNDRYFAGAGFFTPIPLSPEILEKAGFVQHETEFLWAISGVRFRLHRYHVSDNIYCFKWNDYFSNGIQYLHQLQNLYQLLTGKPLQITL